MQKPTSVILATLALAALLSLGCSNRNRTYSGYCDPYSWTANNSTVHAWGGGGDVSARSSDLQSAADSGRAVSVTDNLSGRSVMVSLSDGARSELENQEPCAAIREIMAAVYAPVKSSQAPPTLGGGSSIAPPPPAAADGGGSSNAGSPSPTPLTGVVTLYPGDYTIPEFKNATLTFARPAGDDPRKPAVYVFHGLKMATTSVTLDQGQTVIYVDGALEVKTTTFTVPGTGTPPVPDASNLLILGTTACTSVTFQQCSQQLNVGLYAPAADISLDHVKIFGGAVGKTVSTADALVQYDPHLRVVNFPGLGVASARSVDEKHL